MIRLFCSLLRAPLRLRPRQLQRQRRPRPPDRRESVELTLESDDPTLFGKPDLSPLDTLFEVLGTPGQPSRHAERPGPGHHPLDRHPPAEAERLRGDPADQPRRQQPIRLHVLEARDRAKSSKLAPVFIDASVDQETVYVQAQAILTLRIYHSVSLYDDSSLTLWR